MKKFLMFAVLSLIFSLNAVAATPFTYLSCKQIMKDNLSKDDFGKQDFLNNGEYASHIFYKFKDLKKKATITVYQVGEFWESDWKSKNQNKYSNLNLNMTRKILFIAVEKK